MTRDHLPHLHELAPGLLAGLGYNGRGVAMATVMGRLLALRALGTPAAELGFPVTPLRAVPFHALSGLGARAIFRFVVGRVSPTADDLCGPHARRHLGLRRGGSGDLRGRRCATARDCQRRQRGCNE